MSMLRQSIDLRRCSNETVSSGFLRFFTPRCWPVFCIAFFKINSHTLSANGF
jgi:hypothetical protein